MERRKILVTGGLGYIGSHTIVSLFESGFYPIIVDDLSNSSFGTSDDINKICDSDIPFYILDIRNRKDLSRVFSEHDIWGVIHFAAHKYVGESVSDPIKYYSNNIEGLCSLVSVMNDFGVKNIVYSSSCSVYGDEPNQPVKETMHRYRNAASPYAHTKQIGESMLESFCSAYGTRSFCLRYFNPGGAHPSLLIGEAPGKKESNLFPIMCRSVLEDSFTMSVFGDDYGTPDGTCIRDYIHVCDLSDAHVKAIEKIESYKGDESFFDIVNIGTGIGTSVMECINKFTEVNSIAPKFNISERRNGDVEMVWSETSKSISILNWRPKRTLADICKSSYEWSKKFY